LTRVPIPDGPDEEAKKGKKRALESEEEPGKKQKRSNTTSTKRPISTSQPSVLGSLPPTGSPPEGSDPTTSAVSTEPSKGMKTSIKEPAEVKQKPARASAADSFDSDDAYLSPSKPSASKTPIPHKSAIPKLSPLSKDDVPKKSKSRDERPSEARTILKSSRKVAESATPDVPAQAKRVKFATNLPDPRTKRDKALNVTEKKVRSGGGRSASAKDRVLGKKAALK